MPVGITYQYRWQVRHFRSLLHRPGSCASRRSRLAYLENYRTIEGKPHSGSRLSGSSRTSSRWQPNRSSNSMYVPWKVCVHYLGIRFDYVVASESIVPAPTVNHPGGWAPVISGRLGADEYINPIAGRSLFRPARTSIRSALHSGFLQFTPFRYSTGSYRFEDSFHPRRYDVCGRCIYNTPSTRSQFEHHRCARYSNNSGGVNGASRLRQIVDLPHKVLEVKPGVVCLRKFLSTSICCASGSCSAVAPFSRRSSVLKLKNNAPNRPMSGMLSSRFALDMNGLPLTMARRVRSCKPLKYGLTSTIPNPV